MERASAAAVLSTDMAYMSARLQDELEMLAGKRMLITGGAGFLGYYFIHQLLHWNSRRGSRAAIEVNVYDNFVRGMPRWLDELSANRELRVVKHDVVEPLPPDVPDFSYIVHAASIASPMYYRRYPIETMDANVNGLRALLEYCRQRPEVVEGFLYFSSSEIYGDPPAGSIPTPETFRGYVSCTGPRACYDESKRFGETLCVNFATQFGLPVRIARPFNNYGPGLKITDRRALPDFARDVFEGRDIVLLSDGGPTRTFCYVADAIVGYVKVLTRGRSGEAYNIGVEQPEISIRELAERVVATATELFGYGGQVTHGSSDDAAYLVDNPQRRCPDITKARAELGFEPEVTLGEGIERTLVWYSENRQAEEA